MGKIGILARVMASLLPMTLRNLALIPIFLPVIFIFQDYNTGKDFVLSNFGRDILICAAMYVALCSFIVIIIPAASVIFYRDIRRLMADSSAAGYGEIRQAIIDQIRKETRWR